MKKGDNSVINMTLISLLGRDLAVSWALCAVCLLGHISHLFGVNAPLMHLFHSTGFHLSLSIFTFAGPGRRLILDGLKSLFKGSPNMNTLVGLGALSSFAVSSVAAFIPKLVTPTLFLEGFHFCIVACMASDTSKQKNQEFEFLPQLHPCRCFSDFVGQIHNLGSILFYNRSIL
jgi:cation transport ATPase